MIPNPFTHATHPDSCDCLMCVVWGKDPNRPGVYPERKVMTETQTPKKRVTKCGHCSEPGHNRRRCPLLQVPPPEAPDPEPPPDNVVPITGRPSTDALPFESGDAPDAPEALPIPGLEPENVAPEYAADVNEAVAAALANSGPLTLDDALALHRKVRSRWDAWKLADRTVRDVVKETNQRDSAAEGQFRETVERPEAERGEPVAHLRGLEQNWAAWAEIQKDGRQKRKEARDASRAAKKRLEEAVENTRQMDLPGVGGA